jgi:hypothetical protein
MKDIFADRFMKCNVSQGVVRLDFGRVESIDHEKNEVSMSPSTRLVLPVDGFIHFAEQVDNLKKKLINQGYTGSDFEESGGDEEAEDIQKSKKATDSVH